MTDHNGAAGDEARFLQLIAMFQFAAMQQMGKLTDPVSGEVTRDLPAARASIDMLETIERRTRADRTAAENGLIEKVLFELRMNYVDETQRAPADDAEESGAALDDGEAPADPGEPA